MITKYLSGECNGIYDVVIGAVAIALDSIVQILERYRLDIEGNMVGSSKARLRVRQPKKLVEDLRFFGDFLSMRDNVFTFLVCDPRGNSVGFLTRVVNCAEEMLYGRRIKSHYKRRKRGDVFGHFLQCPIFIVEFSKKSKKYEQASSQVEELYSIYDNLVRNNMHIEWFRKCIVSHDAQTFASVNPFASDIKEFLERGGLAVIVLDTVPKDLDSYTLFHGFLVRKLKRGFIEPKRNPYLILSTINSLNRFKSRYTQIVASYREVKRQIDKILKMKSKTKHKRHIPLDKFKKS